LRDIQDAVPLADIISFRGTSGVLASTHPSVARSAPPS